MTGLVLTWRTLAAPVQKLKARGSSLQIDLDCEGEHAAQLHAHLEDARHEIAGLTASADESERRVTAVRALIASSQRDADRLRELKAAASRLALDRRSAALDRARHRHEQLLYAEIRADKREKALFEELLSVQADLESETRACSELSRTASVGAATAATLHVRVCCSL